MKIVFGNTTKHSMHLIAESNAGGVMQGISNQYGALDNFVSNTKNSTLPIGINQPLMLIREIV